jgi:hypothetical protein
MEEKNFVYFKSLMLVNVVSKQYHIFFDLPGSQESITESSPVKCGCGSGFWS